MAKNSMENEIKKQLIGLYLADDYTMDEALQMISEGVIEFNVFDGLGSIKHSNGVIELFEIALIPKIKIIDHIFTSKTL